MSDNLKDMEPKERREAIWKEIAYRREKQWSIFSWSTSLLLAAIAGVIAVTIKDNYELSWAQRGFLVAALGLLTLYAWRWLGENIHREEHATALIETFDAEFRIGEIFREFPIMLRKLRIYFGYRFIVIGVGIAAIDADISAPSRSTNALALIYTTTTKPTIVLTLPNREQRLDDISSAIAAFQEEAKKQDELSSSKTEAPDHAMQLTAPQVTAPASTATSPPAVQVPRPPPR